MIHLGMETVPETPAGFQPCNRNRYPAGGSNKQPFGNFPQPQHAFGHIKQPMQWQGQQGFSAQHQPTHSTRPQYSGKFLLCKRTKAAMQNTTTFTNPNAYVTAALSSRVELSSITIVYEALCLDSSCRSGDFASAPQTSQTPANPFDLF
ncbi:hypothetical protein PsorP6_001380 [Peronosclerospora sorghi]|uniref:Uncharacterized protein n=1 Tax=Peronosclerospora sorghi TaxID=230839 RepID=A0ACC0WQZ0_9STRA|nr:hypothetical protein PsorP6_001380 [Peronosclerospora sorghi]